MNNYHRSKALLQSKTEILTKFERTITEWQCYENNRQEARSKYNSSIELLNNVDSDILLVKSTLAKLQSFYKNHKEILSEELCRELTDVINAVFDNSYDFSLVIKTIKQIQRTYLIDKKRNGLARVVCGGAVKQMIPFIIIITILKQKSSDFAWLDEAFSNFGIEEIKKIPLIFNMIDDIQLIFTEHKTEMNLEEINVIEVYRDTSNIKEGESNVIHTNKALVEQIQNEINNKEVTEQDINILRTFNVSTI